MYRLYIVLLSVLLVGLIVSLCGAGKSGVPASSSPTITIQQIQQLSELHLVRVPVQDIRHHSLSGMTGSIELLMVVHGHIQLGINLESARLIDVDPDRQFAKLELPMPEVLSVQLDVDRLDLYGVRRHGLWRLMPGSQLEADLITEALRQTQQSLCHTERSSTVMDTAKLNAERAVYRLSDSVGWRIDLSWRK